MEKIGIICEYNPFHNGHIYHINQIKNKFPDSTIILVMSGNYTQRGTVSIIDKWKKTDIALNYVDLVVELPTIFTIQSADTFAQAAVQILNSLKIDYLVFGTESLDANKLSKIVENQNTNTYIHL